MLTISKALVEGTRLLSLRDLPAARLNAEVILAHVLSVDRTYLIANFSDMLTVKNLEKYTRLVEARSKGIPLQYITGTQEFWGLRFVVTPDVLIPRPETETLIEQTLSLAKGSGLKMVDVGTGSGCIAIALAVELKANNAQILATDVSAKGIAIARKNARYHEVADSVHFFIGDLLQPTKRMKEEIDFIICNPPYISKREYSKLPKDVRDYEPRVALTDEADGLAFYRRILPESLELLKPGGYLVLELAWGRCQDVSSLFDESRFKIERIVNDLQNIPRCLVAKKV